MATSSAMSQIAADLEAMAKPIRDVGLTWSADVEGIDSAIEQARANWGGPRPEQDLLAATTYVDSVRDLGAKLGALADELDRFAAAAKTCATDLEGFEARLRDADDETRQTLYGSIESVALSWSRTCFTFSLSIGATWAPINTAIDAAPSGFSKPVPRGTDYYGYVARFALDEDMTLVEIDPTGQLSAAATEAQRDLTDHPLAWLLLAVMETANGDQSVADADGDLSGDDRDDALDPGRVEELIREANELYGLDLTDEEIAELVATVVGTTALASASGNTTTIEDAVARSVDVARPASNDELEEALLNGAPDFVEEATGLFDSEELEASVVVIEGERVYVVSDGTSTAVFSERFQGTVLVVDAVPTNVTDFARQLGEAANGLGTAMDIVDFGSAVYDGWQASAGEPLPERALSVVGAAVPAAAEIGIDGAASTAGAVVCSPGGPILSAACAFSAPIFVDMVASLDNPGAPPSYCVDGEFDAEMAEAMGFDHTSEEVVGCDPVPATEPG